MKLAVSNIALSPGIPVAQMRALPAMGLTGLEVALSRIWDDTWHGLQASAVESYRREVEAAGLQVVGLHSLFWQLPELGLFRDAPARSRTMDFLTHLSAVCRDLGGKTLIYGSAPARRRGDMPVKDAMAETVAFFRELCLRIESHGTCYCFEPLEPTVSDFVNSVHESLAIVDAVGSPALKVQLDAKALVANNELVPATFESVQQHLVHMHVNQPDLGVLDIAGPINHVAIGQGLKAVGYDGWCSIEQRMINVDDPLADVAKSASVLAGCYG